MKVIFMGTPDFAVPTLEAIQKAGHDVVAVVTQPDKARGRGKTVQYPPVKEAALKAGLPVIQPQKVRNPEVIKQLETYQADVMVVVAFGQILPQAVLDIPRYGCINVHASLLPKYRGAAPIQWAVINGERESGVTTMQMNAGLDTGDMLLKTVVLLDPKETGGSLHDKLCQAGAKLLLQTFEGLEAGTLTPIPQGDATTSYAKMLDKSMGKIDWTADAVVIERLMRGLNPWPSAYTTFKGKTLKIWDGDVISEEQGDKAGEITKVMPDGICVSTGKGSFLIREMQLEGKKRMSADAFLRGNTVEPGMFLE